MKAQFNKLKTPQTGAFYIRKDISDQFSDKWHFHDMLELVYIIRGKGERYIGDSIESFQDGDVVLVGRKLPHVWKSDLRIKESNHSECAAIVIQFPFDFLGAAFLELPESYQIRTLLTKAQRGISFSGSIKVSLAQKIKKLLLCEGMERLTQFITLLHDAAITSNFNYLASPHFIDTIYENDLKINKAFEYIMENFSQEINLETISKEVGMNKTAFCRYFKNKTKKTFSTFLNEVRIGYSCKLIREGQLNIQNTIYMSGYSSPSYFYKNFKEIMGISPVEYKNSLH